MTKVQLLAYGEQGLEQFDPDTRRGRRFLHILACNLFCLSDAERAELADFQAKLMQRLGVQFGETKPVDEFVPSHVGRTTSPSGTRSKLLRVQLFRFVCMPEAEQLAQAERKLFLLRELGIIGSEVAYVS